MLESDPHFRSIGRVRSALANATVFRALSQAAGAAIYVLLVRIMTEHDYGVYNLFYSIPAVMGAVLSFGIGNSLLRFLPEYFARKDFALARHFVRWSLGIRFVSTALFLSLCILFWEDLSPIFGVSDLKPHFLIFSAIALTHFQCQIITATLSANLMQQWSSGLSALFALMKLTGYGISTIVGVSLEAILLVDLIAYLIWYGAVWLAYRKRIPRPPEGTHGRFPPPEKKRVFRYAAFYNFNDMGVTALTTTADRLFIAAFLNPVGVGAYAFCTGLNVMVQRLMPVQFFNSVISPLVFTLDYRSQKGRAREYFQFLVKLNYLVQLPIVTLVAAVPGPIISVIFGGKFSEYENLLIAALAFPAAYSFQMPATIVAQLGERAGIILASKIFAVYNVVGAVVLIPLYGVYGAIVATGTAQLFKSLFIWSFVRGVASFKGTGAFFATQLTLWVACWFSIRLVSEGMSDFPALVTAVLIVGLFALLGVRFAQFNRQESGLIRKVAGNRLSGVLQASGVIT